MSPSSLFPLLLAACLTACTGAVSPPSPSADAPAAAPDRAAPTKVEAPRVAPEPMPASALGVGTTRTLVVLAVSPGREREEAGYRLAVQQLADLRLDPQELWLGCHPEATEALGGDGERWVATLSFPNRADADAFLQAKGLSPKAIVEGTIEPCGD